MREAALALDENDPNQACLMAGGDCINEITQDALVALQKEAKRYSRTVAGIVDTAAKKHNLHPHLVWYVLFKPSQWPSSLSKKDKSMLRLSQQVFEASGSSRPSSMSPFTGNPGFELPENLTKVDAMFEDLVGLIRTEIRKPLLSKWVRISLKSIKEIQAKCDEAFGVPCTPREASDLLYGDISRMVLYGRVPGRHPNLIPALLPL